MEIPLVSGLDAIISAAFNSQPIYKVFNLAGVLPGGIQPSREIIAYIYATAVLAARRLIEYSYTNRIDINEMSRIVDEITDDPIFAARLVSAALREFEPDNGKVTRFLRLPVVSELLRPVEGYLSKEFSEFCRDYIATNWKDDPAARLSLIQRAQGLLETLPPTTGEVIASLKRGMENWGQEIALPKAKQPPAPAFLGSVKDYKIDYTLGPDESSVVGFSGPAIDLIERGLKTSVTRAYPLGRVGQIITFNGRPTRYVIIGTKQLTQQDLLTPKFLRELSQTEGLSLWALTNRFKPVIKAGNWVTYFRKID